MSNNSSSKQKYMPVFSYPGGSQIDISSLPQNTIYKWIDTLGGQTLKGPAIVGQLRPDGTPGHGGVVTYNNNVATVEYHGVSYSSTSRVNYGW